MRNTTPTVTTTTVQVTHVIAVSRDNPLVALELARACGADLDWVTELVDLGVLGDQDTTAAPETWFFDSADLRCALEARRLERDFGVGLEAAALILDLEHEVRRLRSALLAQTRT